jgi:actin-related protein 4
MRSPLAGRFVSQQIRLLFAKSQPPVPLVPHYLISSKTPVDAGAPANAVYRKFDVPPHESFRQFEEERVLTEFKESVVQIWTGPGRLGGSLNGLPNEEVAKSLPGRPFEMPDGWNQVFGPERFTVAEGIFDAKMALTVGALDSPIYCFACPAFAYSLGSGRTRSIRRLLRTKHCWP